jgi:hypothetical protein
MVMDGFACVRGAVCRACRLSLDLMLRGGLWGGGEVVAGWWMGAGSHSIWMGGMGGAQAASSCPQEQLGCVSAKEPGPAFGVISGRWKLYVLMGGGCG